MKLRAPGEREAPNHDIAHISSCDCNTGEIVEEFGASKVWSEVAMLKLRAPVAYQPGLMRAVARVFTDSLTRRYVRRLAPRPFRPRPACSPSSSAARASCN